MLERMAVGELPEKHHTALRGSDGRLRYEECLTRAGFDGPYTILYHEWRPHEQRVAEARHGFTLPQATPARALAKRHYKTFELPRGSAAPIDARVPLLFNDDIVLGVARPGAEDPVYFANGDGDDLYFIFQGSGTLRSVFGDLTFSANDYVFVPRGTQT